jgi:Flp pilus assembly protein TadG
MKLKSFLLSSFLFVLFFGFFSAKTALADTITLSGSITTSSGSAVVGATVAVNDSNNDNTTTNSSGDYSLTIPSGTYNVEVTPTSGSGLTSAIAFNQNVSANTNLNFILTPSGTVSLSGYIYDASGGPLANQSISLHQQGSNAVVAYFS